MNKLSDTHYRIGTHDITYDVHRRTWFVYFKETTFIAMFKSLVYAIEFVERVLNQP